MEYLILKAIRFRKKEKMQYEGGAEDFFILLKIDKQNMISIIYVFSKSSRCNIYKLARNQQARFLNMEETNSSLLNNILPQAKWMSNHDSRIAYNIETVLKTDDYEEIKTFAENNNIVLFEPYVSTETVPLKIVNNTDIKNFQIINILDSKNFQKISKISISEKLNNYGYMNTDYFEIEYENKTISSKLNEYNNKYGWNISEKNRILYYDNSFKNWYENHFYNEKDDAFSNGNIYIKKYENQSHGIVKAYVCTTKNSIKITILEIKIEIEKEIVATVNKKYEYSYSLGEEISCVKYMKTKTKDISPFEMFNINSQTIRNPSCDFYFENCENIYEYFLENKIFLERCGFVKLLSEYKGNIKLKCAFILYLSVIYEYPVIELIVKMGHTNLIEDIFKQLFLAGRKESILSSVKELEELINKNTTKGSMVLRFPTYIGDYLMKKQAKLNEYLFWRDIFEITNISKENFDKFLDSHERLFINITLTEDIVGYNNKNWQSLNLQEIIKYEGYDFFKTIKYIYNNGLQKYKDTENVYYNSDDCFVNVSNYLKDSLLIAEEIGFELELYPDNLTQIHDQMAAIQREKTEKLEAVVVEEIANECENYLQKMFNSNAADLPTIAMKTLTYTFPKNQLDFTQEGQNQHNCVAGYFSRVKKGDCIIFFVRLKENVKNSYITAEIKKTGIGQVMFSNNRSVPCDSMEYKYCKFIANKLLKCIERDEILALNKITKRKLKDDADCLSEIKNN